MPELISEDLCITQVNQLPIIKAYAEKIQLGETGLMNIRGLVLTSAIFHHAALSKRLRGLAALVQLNGMVNLGMTYK